MQATFMTTSKIVHCNQAGFIPNIPGDLRNANQQLYYINGCKSKSDSIISIDTKKAFDEVQHTFIIKILIKMWTKGEYFNVGIMLLCTMERLSLCYSNADFSALISCFNPDMAL